MIVDLIISGGLHRLHIIGLHMSSLNPDNIGQRPIGYMKSRLLA